MEFVGITLNLLILELGKGLLVWCVCNLKEVGMNIQLLSNELLVPNNLKDLVGSSQISTLMFPLRLIGSLNVEPPTSCANLYTLSKPFIKSLM